MPANYDYTEIENANESIEEIAFMPSTLETIDRAMFGFAEGELDLHVNTNKGWKKTPIIWTSAERASQIKNDKEKIKEIPDNFFFFGFQPSGI